MDSLAKSPLQPKRNKTKSILLVVFAFVVISFFIWILWCLSTAPCFLANERECIEYGKEQDKLNPQVIDLNFSFLISPGQLVYPWFSTYKKEEGSVVLYIEIDDRGNIISNRISESSGFERLDTAAIESLSTFKIDLEKLNKTDFPIEKPIKFTFKLH